MQRRADWESRLLRLIGKAERRAHRPGSHDCCLWPANAIKAQTGIDLGRGLRGKYRSIASGYRVLKGMGFASPLELADAKLGPRIPVLLARRGDIVSDGVALGVMWAGHALFVGQEGRRNGLVTMPVGKLACAWRVGG